MPSVLVMPRCPVTGMLSTTPSSGVKACKPVALFNDNVPLDLRMPKKDVDLSESKLFMGFIELLFYIMLLLVSC